jgi:hypothetical protein
VALHADEVTDLNETAVRIGVHSNR